MLTCLKVNGIPVDRTNDNAARAGLGAAAGEIGYEELLAWVREHET